MSAPVTESDTFTASVVAPSANDTNYPTVVPQMATALANRTKYLRTTLMTGGSSGFGADTLLVNATASQLTDITLPATGRADLFRNALTGLAQTTRWVRDRVLGAGAAADTVLWQPALIGADSTYWAAAASSSAAAEPFINQKTVDVARAMLSMPHVKPGLVLGTLTATVRSATSHGGLLPSSMPLIALVGVDSSGNAVDVASAADASADATAFEARHTISCVANHAIQADRAYHVAVRGESGSNSQANSFKLYRLSMTLWYV
jgi:hypothetical protein